MNGDAFAPELQPADLQELALRLGAVVAFLEERAEQASLQSAQGAQALHQAADGFGACTRQLSQDAVSAIATQAQGAIRQGMAAAAEQCGQRLQEAAQAAARAAGTFDAQARALAGAQRGMAWKAGVALLVGAVLAAGGSALVAWKSLRDLERAGFGEDILQATRSGAITRCGEALCVRVGVDPRRAGARGEFLLVESD